MKLAAYESPLPMPKSVPATHSVLPIDLSSRRVSALMNILVFTPYAIYLARGQLPPPWLIVASLAWTGINFFDDLKYLIQGQEIIEGQLGNAAGCGCAGLGCANGCGSPRAPLAAPTGFQGAMQYRVNR